jgi:BMFP domain-containing protein YqiC
LQPPRAVAIVKKTLAPENDPMTQTSNRMFDEMARLMGDAASVAQGVKREAEGVFRTQIERFVNDLDLVKREEFDVVREMASKAAAENEKLKKRVAELEAKLGVAGEAAPKPKRASRQPKSATE